MVTTGSSSSVSEGWYDAVHAGTTEFERVEVGFERLERPIVDGTADANEVRWWAADD